MNNHVSLDQGAFYSIQMVGILSQSWAEQYGDLQVEIYHAPDQEQPPVTTISGEIRDQAALSGLLNLVYSLGLPLLSVSYLGQP